MYTVQLIRDPLPISRVASGNKMKEVRYKKKSSTKLKEIQDEKVKPNIRNLGKAHEKKKASCS